MRENGLLSIGQIVSEGVGLEDRRRAERQAPEIGVDRVEVADDERRHAQRIEVRAKSTATTRVEIPGAAKQVVVNDGSVLESDLTNNTFDVAAP